MAIGGNLLISSVFLIITYFSNKVRQEDEQRMFKDISKELVLPVPEVYDFIIVGGGTAGCILASRLSKDYSVLLLEAGGDPPPVQSVPALNYITKDAPDMNFLYRSQAEKNAGRAFGGKIDISTGKILGGSSSSGGMIWERGHPNDYDLWANLTKDDSWKYENVAKYFKKIEKIMGQNRLTRSGNDTKRYTKLLPDNYAPGIKSWLAAGKELGYKRSGPNAPEIAGFSPLAFTKKNGRRISTYKAYLKPTLQKRRKANLRIHRYSVVSEIVFDQQVRRAARYHPMFQMPLFGHNGHKPGNNNNGGLRPPNSGGGHNTHPHKEHHHHHHHGGNGQNGQHPQGGSQHHRPQGGSQNQYPSGGSQYPQGGSNNQYPSGGHNNQYPPGGSNTQYPSGGHNNQYPSGGHNNQYPSGGHNNQHPSGGHNNQYPSGGHNNQYPSGGHNNQYPSGGSNNQYPSGGSNNQYPPGGSNNQHPSGGHNNQYPPGGSHHHKPPHGDHHHKPPHGGHHNRPGHGGHPQKPSGGSQGQYPSGGHHNQGHHHPKYPGHPHGYNKHAPNHDQGSAPDGNQNNGYPPPEGAYKKPVGSHLHKHKQTSNKNNNPNSPLYTTTIQTPGMTTDWDWSDEDEWTHPTMKSTLTTEYTYPTFEWTEKFTTKKPMVTDDYTYPTFEWTEKVTASKKPWSKPDLQPPHKPSITHKYPKSTTKGISTDLDEWPSSEEFGTTQNYLAQQTSTTSKTTTKFTSGDMSELASSEEIGFSQKPWEYQTSKRPEASTMNSNNGDMNEWASSEEEMGNSQTGGMGTPNEIGLDEDKKWSRFNANENSFGRSGFKRAIGVKYTRHGLPQVAYAAKEIILSAGTFVSPVILMKSGIGPEGQTKAAKIEPISVLPVGRNLMDHAGVAVQVHLNKPEYSWNAWDNMTYADMYEFLKNGTGPMTGSEYSAQAKLQSTGLPVPGEESGKDGGKKWPDLQIRYSYIGYEYGAVTCSVENTRPRSKGWVKLNTTATSMTDPNLPIIKFNYFADEKDLNATIEGINFCLNVFESTETYKKLGAQLSTFPYEPCMNFQFRSHDYWKCYVRSTAYSTSNSAGTCRMGYGAQDPNAVVDSKLRVIGVEGLRVVDASVMPYITNSNAMAPTMMIAEKAAADILHEHKAP